MTPTETITILRRLADDWRREEAQLCKQFGDVIVPRSMRARRIKDTEAIDAAVEMIEAAEEDRALCDKLADILTRTASVLKGEPKPLHRHGWHDLPDVARKLVAAAGQNTVNAMLAHSRKSGKQRARKPLAKHAKEAGK